jgi:hypothetical protein
MSDRRWPLAVAALVAAVVLFGAGWTIGRSSAPEKPAASDQGGRAEASGPAVRFVGEIPIGVQRSRAGALAAADNYVATVSENVVKDPRLYSAVVRRVFAPPERVRALREATRARTLAPAAVADYAAGGSAVALIGARRLDTYDGTRAQVTTWLGGVVWGPSRRSTQRWQLVETDLRWDGQKWLVERMRPAARPAPAPAVTRADDASSFERLTFDRELRGMTAPVYGAG